MFPNSSIHKLLSIQGPLSTDPYNNIGKGLYFPFEAVLSFVIVRFSPTIKHLINSCSLACRFFPKTVMNKHLECRLGDRQKNSDASSWVEEYRNKLIEETSLLSVFPYTILGGENWMNKGYIVWLISWCNQFCGDLCRILGNFDVTVETNAINIFIAAINGEFNKHKCYKRLAYCFRINEQNMLCIFQYWSKLQCRSLTFQSAYCSLYRFCTFILDFLRTI